ncbi:MAG: DUF4136 domain-containing protein [Chryseolinea sp.]
MKHFFRASLVLLLAGCYPQGPDYAEDTDVVYTTYDDKYAFKDKGTYAMPDKIVMDVEIDNGDTTYEYMPDKFAAPIFDKIEENMTALGYDRVQLKNDPDLLLTPAAISSTTYFYSYWYDWWYGCYYGCGWGWYYPPYYTVSSYTTGSMIMTLSDPNAAADSPINRSKTVWVSAANGLVSYAYDISRVTKSIDQAFKQSPYLTTK